MSGAGKKVNNNMGEASARGRDRTGRSRHAERDQFVSFLHEGQDVYDNQNHKIGTVSKVYPPAGPGQGFFIKVLTGFPGLGHTQLSPMAVHAPALFIPSRYLDLSHDQLELAVERSQINQMGWDKRPAGIQD